MSANKITPITPAMQKAWIEYDGPELSEKDMKALRVAAFMRHAFMSGFEAGEAHNMPSDISKLALLREFYDFAQAAIYDRSKPGFGYPLGALQQLEVLFGPMGYEKAAIAAGKPETGQAEPIPELVYWDAECNNFYSMTSRLGQGGKFFNKPT